MSLQAEDDTIKTTLIRQSETGSKEQKSPWERRGHLYHLLSFVFVDG